MLFDTDEQNEAEIRGYWKDRGGYGRVKHDEAILLRCLDAARLKIIAEREACAKAAENYEPQHELNTAIGRRIGQNIAKIIRDRSARQPVVG